MCLIEPKVPVHDLYFCFVLFCFCFCFVFVFLQVKTKIKDPNDDIAFSRQAVIIS